jgi:hypothetical protein
MPGGLCHRSLLAPAGHAAVDQGGVCLQADIGSQAQALHDSRTVTFQQGVRLADKFKDGINPLRGLEVDADTAFAAIEEVQAGLLGIAEHAAARAFHPDDVGAHVRQ